MNDAIRQKLEGLILKALEENYIMHAKALLDMRATVAYIKSME